MQYKAYTREELEAVGFVYKGQHPALSYICSWYVHPTSYMGSNEVEDNGALQQWKMNSVRHREGGPAIIYSDNSWIWVEHGKNHRYNEPASVYVNDGEIGTTRWFIRGNVVAGADYKSWIKEQGIDLNNLSDNDKILIDLRWGEDEKTV